MSKITLAIHGGAGTILRSQMTPDLEREYRRGIEDALKSGWAILEKGGSSLDAVEAAVTSLEDFPLFNAGRGSVFTHEGQQEMDAAIMDGRKLRAGSVAFVKNIRNPVSLRRSSNGTDRTRPSRRRRSEPIRRGIRRKDRAGRVLLHRTPLDAAARRTGSRPRPTRSCRQASWHCRRRWV